MRQHPSAHKSLAVPCVYNLEHPGAAVVLPCRDGSLRLVWVVMREQFERELAALGRELAGMCEAATTALRQATEALLSTDLALAEQVISGDARLDAARERCEEHAQRLIALQAPMARDLRRILAAVYCADKIERMGDLAAHIADIARRNYPAAAFPAEVGDALEDLGALVGDMAAQLGDLIMAPTGTGFAALDRADSAVDALHTRLMHQVTSNDWTHGVPAAIDVALLTRFYERFADQAVSAARRVDFAATGQLPKG